MALKAGIQPAFNVSKKFDVDYPTAGLSYEYENFVFDARYHIGVTKLLKNSDEGRNSTFMFSVGYKFDM